MKRLMILGAASALMCAGFATPSLDAGFANTETDVKKIDFGGLTGATCSASNGFANNMGGSNGHLDLKQPRTDRLLDLMASASASALTVASATDNPNLGAGASDKSNPDTNDVGTTAVGHSTASGSPAGAPRYIGDPSPA